MSHWSGAPRTCGDLSHTTTQSDQAWARPHMRGSVRRPAGLRGQPRAHPAHAGICPRGCCSASRSVGLPRRCGDQSDREIGSSCSHPTLRGSVLRVLHTRGTRIALAPHAGIGPLLIASATSQLSPLRTRGDQSRWILDLADPMPLRPAHAGISLSRTARQKTCAALPCTRGIGPPGKPTRAMRSRFSPHTWGSVLRLRARRGLVLLRPAHAGISLASTGGRPRSWSPPRIRCWRAYRDRWTETHWPGSCGVRPLYLQGSVPAVCQLKHCRCPYPADVGISRRSRFCCL